MPGTADEVKLGRGFAFWRCSMELTQEGEEHVDEVVAAVYQVGNSPALPSLSS